MSTLCSPPHDRHPYGLQSRDVLQGADSAVSRDPGLPWPLVLVLTVNMASDHGPELGTPCNPDRTVRLCMCLTGLWPGLGSEFGTDLEREPGSNLGPYLRPESGPRPNLRCYSISGSSILRAIDDTTFKLH